MYSSSETHPDTSCRVCKGSHRTEIPAGNTARATFPAPLLSRSMGKAGIGQNCKEINFW